MYKFNIETDDRNEIGLALNANKLASACYDLLSWRRALYNGKEGDITYLYKGELYTPSEFMKMHKDLEPDYKVVTVLTEKQVLRRLDECLSDIQSIIENYYE